jgi:hypothetical protein
MFSQYDSSALQIYSDAVLFSKSKVARVSSVSSKGSKNTYEECSHRRKIPSVFTSHANCFDGADWLQPCDTKIWHRWPV